VTRRRNRRHTRHTHPCASCRTPVACFGEEVQNYDGAPTVICLAYHELGGSVAAVWCADCDSDLERQADEQEADAAVAQDERDAEAAAERVTDTDEF